MILQGVTNLPNFIQVHLTEIVTSFSNYDDFIEGSYKGRQYIFCIYRSVNPDAPVNFRPCKTKGRVHDSVERRSKHLFSQGMYLYVPLNILNHTSMVLIFVLLNHAKLSSFTLNLILLT